MLAGRKRLAIICYTTEVITKYKYESYMQTLVLLVNAHVTGVLSILLPIMTIIA